METEELSGNSYGNTLIWQARSHEQYFTANYEKRDMS